MTFIKQISSFILPATVLILVPWWIHRDWQIHFGIHAIAGSILCMTGITAMILTISSFIKSGKGTLAPWAPAKIMVVTGLYRYVRNPMILGVFTVLLGESLLLESKNIFIWALCFLVINTIYFILSEEPGLEKRFGAPYRHYKRHVSRWMPRLTPYDPNQPEIK